MKNRLKIRLSVGGALLVTALWLSECSNPFGPADNPYDPHNPGYVAVTGISLDRTTMNLTVSGGTGTITATIAPANASGRDVNWTSSNSAVAAVDSTGIVSPVMPGTATVTATTVDGDKKATCLVTVSTVSSSPAPTGLSVTAGNAQVALSWNAVSGATGYNVYRSATTGTQGTMLNSSALTVTSYTDTTATNGNEYYYCVTDITSGGESVASNQESATPQVPAPPAPTDVNAVVGNGQVTITWKLVSVATSYNLYWSTADGATIGSGTKIPGVTSPYVQNGLANGTTYYYIVTAVNTGGESLASSQVSAVPSASNIVSSISLNSNGFDLSPNGRFQMIATVLPSDAPQTVTWSLSNSSVGSVSTDGLVTASSIGCDLLTATAAGGMTATCLFFVWGPDGNGYYESKNFDAQCANVWNYNSPVSSVVLAGNPITIELYKASGLLSTEYGLGFCISTDFNFYYLLYIDGLGNFTVSKQSGSTNTTLVPWTANSALKSGFNQVNQIYVEQPSSGTILITFNHDASSQVSISDSSFTSGRIGFWWNTGTTGQNFTSAPEEDHFKLLTPVAYP
jgi:uncharacterized protein YjdB